MKGWSSQGLGWASIRQWKSLRASCAMVMVVRIAAGIKATAIGRLAVACCVVENVVVLRDKNAAAVDTKSQQEGVPS